MIGREQRVPEAARQHEHLAEPKARRRGELAAAADEIVLAPRVIDRHAFDEYVKLLRADIDRATSESELLARRAEAGAIILDQLERFMGDNGSTIEHAAEVLAGIDERMTASRELLDEVERRSASLSKASRDAEQAIEARAEAFHSRLRSIVDTAMDRFEETEDQLTARAASARRELLDRLEQMRSRGEETLSRLDANAAELTGETEEIVARTQARLDALRAPARELLGSIESRFAALDARADEHASHVKAVVDESMAKLADAQTAARTQDAALRDAIAAGTAASDSVREGCESALHRARGRIESLLSELGEQAASIVERGAAALETAAATAGSAIESATTGAHDAERRLRSAIDDAARAEASPKLREVLEQCSAAESTAAQTANQVNGLEAQASSARSMLADAILEGATNIDALDARAEKLRTAGASEADRLEALLAEASGAGESDLSDRIAQRVRSDTRAEMRDELEMATAALATLSERVRSLEASAAPASKPTTSKAGATKASPKKAPTRKATPKKAAAKKTASQKAEPKPAARKRSNATPEVKPTPDSTPAPKPTS